MTDMSISEMLTQVINSITNRIHQLEVQEHNHLSVVKPVVFGPNWSDYLQTYVPAGWWIDTSSTVHLQGMIKRTGAHVNGELVLTLPPGARPSGSMIFNLRVAGGTCRFDLNSAGQLLISDDPTVTSAESWTSLGGIAFHVG